MSTTMNISLPETLKDFVRERVREADFSNPSDYVRHLIREDQKRAAQEKLDALLLQGLSEAPTALTAADLDALRAEARRRLAGRQG